MPQASRFAAAFPIVFPWFATDSKSDRIDGHPGPAHGFARTQDWTLESARRLNDDVHLIFTLGPSAISRALGFDHFALKLEFLIGPSLTLRMTVRNDSDRPLLYEQAFHTYFAVVDVHEVKLDGLEPSPYIDKTDAMKVNRRRIPADVYRLYGPRLSEHGRHVHPP